jgi:uncharacterized membrane protein
VGRSFLNGGQFAAEWSHGRVINLGPGDALGINDAGQVVGTRQFATEWSHGHVINLGGLPGSGGSVAYSINDRGQAVGVSAFGGDFGVVLIATEWSGGRVIDLGGLPGFTLSEANSINDAGQAVAFSELGSGVIPEPSTWAMILLGFAGLALAGYRRAKAGRAILAR